MATGQTHGGKGSTSRSVDKEKFNSNFDAIFKKAVKELKDEKEKENVPRNTERQP